VAKTTIFSSESDDSREAAEVIKYIKNAILVLLHPELEIGTVEKIHQENKSVLCHLTA
jgi:hypothetical protein